MGTFPASGVQQTLGFECEPGSGVYSSIRENLPSMYEDLVLEVSAEKQRNHNKTQTNKTELR